MLKETLKIDGEETVPMQAASAYEIICVAENWAQRGGGGCPGTRTARTRANPPTSAYRVLGLKACATVLSQDTPPFSFQIEQRHRVMKAGNHSRKSGGRPNG